MSDFSLLRPPLTVDYGQDLRVFNTWFSRLGFVLVLLGLVVAPFVLSPFWVSVANFAGIAVIGAVGLNVVAGDAGQVSIGHSFFLGVGAYVGAYLNDAGWPFLLWLLVAGAAAALASFLVGPFTLRLRGLYLAFATVALIFVGQHLFLNLESFTGGGAGRSVPPPTLGGVPLTEDGVVWGLSLTGDQKWYFVILPIAAITALAARNLQRSRLGRAFNAVRDHDIAAWVTGIELARTKVKAFVLSAFAAGIAGALLGAYLRFINPDMWGLLLAVQYLAMIIVGGMGSVLGAVLGAIFITIIPRVIDRASEYIPFIESGVQASPRGFTVELLATLIYGGVVMLFLMFEPQGLAGIWRRIKRYFVTWPYKY